MLKLKSNNKPHMQFIKLLFCYLLLNSCHVNNNSTGSNTTGKSSPDCSVRNMLSIIKSSDFPFDNINSEKINLLLDTVTDSAIIVKVFFDTDGTGTLGFARLNLSDGKLFNTSAYLESPQELTYDGTFFNKLKNDCPDLF